MEQAAIRWPTDKDAAMLLTKYREIFVKLLRATAFCVATFSLGGCSMRITDFTVISTKNVNIPAKQQASRVTGNDCVIVFLIPFGIPNLKTAIDKAIESAGPGYDALIDGVAYIDNKSFLFGQECYRVEGTPISTKSGGVSLNDANHGFVYLHSERG